VEGAAEDQTTIEGVCSVQFVFRVFGIAEIAGIAIGYIPTPIELLSAEAVLPDAANIAAATSTPALARISV
jgi:hypothetical protein